MLFTIVDSLHTYIAPSCANWQGSVVWLMVSFWQLVNFANFVTNYLARICVHQFSSCPHWLSVLCVDTVIRLCC